MKNAALCFLLVIFAYSQAYASQRAELRKIYDEDGNRIFENLESRIAEAKAGEELAVIVLYKEKAPVAGSYAVRLNIGANKVNKSFSVVPAVAARMTGDEIEQAARDPWVEHIELDAPVRATLNSARESFGINRLANQFGFTGDGDGITGNYSTSDIVVAVADTGVNPTHPDLSKKVLYWKDFVNGRAEPYDDEGHGTHVAGVLLGAGRVRRSLAGVAPQAALVAFKVLDSSGVGSFSQIMSAAEEAIARKDEYRIRVLNLSLAADGSSNGRDALSLACERVVQNGIVVVVAAGNNGPDNHTVGSPGAARLVLTVGAGADLGEHGFFVAAFSSRGPTADGRKKPDVWAPGVHVLSPRRSGGYSEVSGTSFAAPFVAGVVALMLNANPNLSPGQVKETLVRTAVKWGPGVKNNEAGAGRIQPYQAVTAAAGITANLQPPVVPTLKFYRGRIGRGQAKTVVVPVNDIHFPIAVTAVSYRFPHMHVQIELFSPRGELLRTRRTFRRQETLIHTPATPGLYTLRILALNGTGPVLVDISAGMAK